MDAFADLMQGYVQAGTIPGAVLFAKDTTGKVDYSAAFSGPGDEYQKSTVLEAASFTKLLTTISALQLVENGTLDLQLDVAELLPVLADLKVLSSGVPERLDDRAGPLTLDQLLTHTAGLGYPFTDRRLLKFAKSGEDRRFPAGTVNAAFDLPLSYQPGTSWKYSSGMDRVGQVVELTTGKSLEQYFKENIFAPLGIINASFWNLPKADMAFRSQPGEPVKPDPEALSFTQDLTECFGGQGLLIAPAEFIKILFSLLKNDGVLLKPETVQELFRPRLSRGQRTDLANELQTGGWAVGDLPDTDEYDWCYGGLVTAGYGHPFRQRGAISWSGAPSLYWFIDVEVGLCGVFGSQVMPAADPEVTPVIKAWEEEMYRLATQ